MIPNTMLTICVLFFQGERGTEKKYTHLIANKGSSLILLAMSTVAEEPCQRKHINAALSEHIWFCFKLLFDILLVA